jgi:hypothetical protein
MSFRIKNFLSLLLILSAVSFRIPLAHGAGTPQSYVLEISYENGLFSLPEDDSRMDPSTQVFIEATLKSYPLYSIDLYDASGKILSSSKIDQKTAFAKLVDENHNSDHDWVRIVAPYDKKANRIVIKNDFGEVLFDELLYNTNILREDDPTVMQANSNGSRSASASSSSPSWIIVLLIIALVAVGGFLAWFWIKSRRNKE